MSKNQVLKIYLKDLKKPFTFKLSEKNYLSLLTLMDNASENELICFEYLTFIKKDFKYATFK